jgi:hypothetical protein
MAEEKSTLTVYRDTAFLAAIYLYFSGWIYVYYYFNYFGISIRQIDIELYYLFIYSSNIFIYYKNQWIVVAIIFAILLIFNLLYGQRLSKPFKKAFMIAALILAFPIIYSISKDVAIAEAESDWKSPDLPVINFQFKKEFTGEKFEPGKFPEKDIYYFSAIRSNSEKQLLFSLNNKRKLRLLAASREKYYVLCVIEGNTVWPEVKEIPKEAISFATINK